MKKKYVLVFFILITLVHTIIQLIFSWQSRQLLQFYKRETEILHSNIGERFALLMDSHRAIGIVASEYLSSGVLKKNEYQELSKSVLNNFDEIVGLNILNEKGVIVQVSPINENFRALGKTTQNIAALERSAKNLESYWLSPPFDLYQGIDGFSFYMPLYKDNKLMGWVAPVIGQKKFFEKFINSKFLKSYHLIIKDKLTGKDYFRTNGSPHHHADVFQNTIPVWGRSITFISWPRQRNIFGIDGLVLSLIFSLLLATLGTFSVWLYEQRTRTKKRLEALNGLLKLTVQDTSQSLVSIQHQLNHLRLGNSSIQLDRVNRHVNYIGSLLRQIEVLQRLSGTIDSSDFTRTPILPMLLEISDLLHDQFAEKKLILTYDPQEMSRVEILGDKWLICHSVFSHFVRQAIKFSPIGSDIEFKHTRINNFWVFSISHTGLKFADNLIQGKITDEENFVAEKVIHLHKGKLSFENTANGGSVLIKLPVPGLLTLP